MRLTFIGNVLFFTILGAVNLSEGYMSSTTTSTTPSGLETFTHTLPDYSDHPCDRECVDGVNYECVYEMDVETYHTMSADCGDCPFVEADCSNPNCVSLNGHPRGIATVNRMIPGPPIHVCRWDLVTVNVHNKRLSDTGVSIHWHGIHMRDSPHMDGVAMLTQCPIPAGSTFQYKFPAAQVGTNFYHSHIGIDRGDGLFGALVVREPNDPHQGDYDWDLTEHTIVLTDWMQQMTVERFFCFLLAAKCPRTPLAILIQGMGKGTLYEQAGDPTQYYTPYAEFSVKAGDRYRFRIVGNGIVHCPFKLSIDNHRFQVIASDGHSTENVWADSVVLQTGERYDFILEADQPVDNYWIRVQGLGFCSRGQVHQEAVLRYEGAGPDLPTGTTTYADSDRSGTTVNPLNGMYEPGVNIPASHLKSVRNEEPWLDMEVDYRMFWDVHFVEMDNPHTHRRLTPQINHITNQIPPVPLLGGQSEHGLIDESKFCNSTTIPPECEDSFCTCIHRPVVDLCDVVEVILIDEGGFIPDSNHPVHLHGYAFAVVGMGKPEGGITKESIKALDGPNHDGLPRDLENPVFKDTVAIPNGGYTIIRFYADNPGFWFLHCHIEFHVDEGMGLFLQVGNYDQIPRVPPNFPTCGTFTFCPASATNHRQHCLRRGGNDVLVGEPEIYTYDF